MLDKLSDYTARLNKLFYEFRTSEGRDKRTFFFPSRRRHTRSKCDWSSDVCSSDLGLRPAGDDGGYMQKVEFTGVRTLPATSFSLQPEHGKAVDLKLGEDYVTSNQTQTDSADIDTPIVFVGYGIEAPEYRWNDFKGVDVKGKVLLVIVNEPPSKDPKFFNAEAMTYYVRWTYKSAEPARTAAICIL